MRSAVGRDTQPLSDVTVLELGHIVAGPFCSLLLADLGATVIKVEHPSGGDALRGSDEFGSSIFNYVNRNKKSITIDLKQDAGKTTFLELVEEADVLIENFGPGATDRLGVSYDDVKEINPELVYCSIKGFNPGPYENRPALDPVAEALSGLMSTTGYPDHPPARAGTNVADKAASLYGALGIMAALHQRSVTGHGQHLTAPIFESTVTLMGGTLLFSQLTGQPKEPFGGGGQSQWAPYDVFQTGDEKWVFIGVTSDRHWEAFATALDIEVAKYETSQDRSEHASEVNDLVTETLQEYSRDEFLAMFEGVNVPVAPVNNTVEAADDRHLHETGMLGPMTTAEGDTQQVDTPASPLLATGFDRLPIDDPPGLGEHTAEILDQMGYDEDEIADLRAADAI